MVAVHSASSASPSLTWAAQGAAERETRIANGPTLLQMYGDSVHLRMIIRSVGHRGLLRLIEDDDSRELRVDLVRRLRNILTALIAAPDMSGVSGPPGWRVHQLRGDRSGTWGISVSGNWRLTFDIRQNEICDLNLEDYH
jgi:toxin HigB-1